jgi:hypothetical protein
MSGFTEYRASDASEQSGRDVVLTLETSTAMLPLVERVAADLVQHQQKLSELYQEREVLDERRHTLDWPKRSRRYAVQEEIALHERFLREVLTELDGLGLFLLDPARGMIGFPTRVNNQRAHFSWMPGEAGIQFWSYTGDTVRRPIPEHWTKPAIPPRRGRQRPKK